jgi:tRNA-splicing ligase RtcB
VAEEWRGIFEKIDDYRWLLPKREGMRVPGLIYTNEKMLGHIRMDRTPVQVANVAHLPGIVGKSLAMPDIHWGYGFAIGGVAGMDIEAGGVISPGGVGYDINCLSGDSLILHNLGYNLKIKEFERMWTDEKIGCFDFNSGEFTDTGIVNFLRREPDNRVLKVITKTGRKIIATEEHPFYTRDGMVELKNLSQGSEVAIYPFGGVPYEKPGDEIIIAEKDIRRILLTLEKDSRGHGLEQIIIHLKRRGLLPLRYGSQQLPYILKVMGYVFGDGSIHFAKKREEGITQFSGNTEDLESIRKDIASIGYRCSGVYSRKRKQKIETSYSTYEFESTDTECKVSSSSFAILLVALGVPLGNKARQEYHIPQWLFKAPLWQKRLFLASFFGAEMTTPKTMTGHGHNFYCPVVSMNKKGKFVKNGILFFREISELLNDFGVNTLKISQRKENVNTFRLRLTLSGRPENMINLFSRVGFEYNRKWSWIANVAVQYLKWKQLVIAERKEMDTRVKEKQLVKGVSARDIFSGLDSSSVNFRFVERSVYEGKNFELRVPANFPDFDQFSEKAREGLEGSGMVWDEIESIKEVDFDGYVYDFTVAHPHHNFVANNFVVSNCGVRLLRTNLKEEEVRPRLQDLISGLFVNIPSGVGSKGKIKISSQEVMEVLEKGSQWTINRGYGHSEDALHTEEKGSMEGADATKVSQRALERGRQQLGTLGAGNHFLEIQVVEEIYEEGIAEVFGIFPGQITVMIHTGSRGLGYQICDDYLRVMGNAVRKYNISLPDRQLACAPVESVEGQDYLKAMRCAANYAWANRQCIMHWTRDTFERVFKAAPKDLGMVLIYDVAHNIGKIEEHLIEGKKRTLCIHRKGATRAFPPGHPDVPHDYNGVGQPVIIPGTMGSYSYVLVGTQRAIEETWGSTCHGAGRVMSRTKALQDVHGQELQRQLRERGIIIQAKGYKTLAEEAPSAYKDVDEVVDVCHNAGISRKVAKMRPIGVIKG